MIHWSMAVCSWANTVIPDHRTQEGKTSFCSQLHTLSQQRGRLTWQEKYHNKEKRWGKDQHYQSKGEYEPSPYTSNHTGNALPNSSYLHFAWESKKSRLHPCFYQQVVTTFRKDLHLLLCVWVIPLEFCYYALSFSATHLFYSSLLKTTILTILPSNVNKLLKTSSQH